MCTAYKLTLIPGLEASVGSPEILLLELSGMEMTNRVLTLGLALA